MILTKHSLTVEASCPMDDALDVYEVTVETYELITVEEILNAISDLTRKPIFQEELTRKLKKRLDAKIRTVGEHSGVTTTCETTWP